MDLWRAFRDRNLPPPIDDEAWAPYARLLSGMDTPTRPRDFTLTPEVAASLAPSRARGPRRLAPLLAPAMAMAILAVAVGPAMVSAPGESGAGERNGIETSGGGAPVPAMDAASPVMIAPAAVDPAWRCPTASPDASPTPSGSPALPTPAPDHASETPESSLPACR